MEKDPNRVYPTDPPKSPILACILSLLLVGLGQMYLGQIAKGLVILAGSVTIAVITFGLSIIPIYLIVMVDAYNIGKKLESGKSVGKWEWF